MEHRFHIASAGTHAYHTNNPPDRRAQAAAGRRGISLDNIRARRIESADFGRFDYIFAMDSDNALLLREAAGEAHAAKIKLFLEFATGSRGAEVPDPYYGGAAGFERVLDLVEDAALRLLEKLGERR